MQEKQLEIDLITESQKTSNTVLNFELAFFAADPSAYKDMFAKNCRNILHHIAQYPDEAALYYYNFGKMFNFRIGNIPSHISNGDIRDLLPAQVFMLSLCDCSRHIGVINNEQAKYYVDCIVPYHIQLMRTIPEEYWSFSKRDGSFEFLLEAHEFTPEELAMMPEDVIRWMPYLAQMYYFPDVPFRCHTYDQADYEEYCMDHKLPSMWDKMYETIRENKIHLRHMIPINYLKKNACHIDWVCNLKNFLRSPDRKEYYLIQENLVHYRFPRSYLGTFHSKEDETSLSLEAYYLLTWDKDFELLATISSRAQLARRKKAEYENRKTNTYINFKHPPRDNQGDNP